jgi:hypothetical protein
VTYRGDSKRRNSKPNDSRDVNVIQIIVYNLTIIFVLEVMNIVVNYILTEVL